MFPALLGVLGATGTGVALAPALQVITIPIGVAGALLLARAWFTLLRHGVGSAGPRWALAVLIVATSLVAILRGLRFAGNLGG